MLVGLVLVAFAFGIYNAWLNGDRVQARMMGQVIEGDVIHVAPDDKITLRTASYSFDILIYPAEVVCKVKRIKQAKQEGEL